MGAGWIERHITLDHGMWEVIISLVKPSGVFKLVKGIRDVESSMSAPAAARILLEKEKLKKDTLRR